ncbi:hypothetical protein [Pengzhenrongella sicca]|uniref:Uncharacterized protein n=1 Tax=Pengzhenrongella sicca TaxID=2819238 RepID=A0A8A4ZIA3_9MICO|nr:hypothetical protein [Pengzhenrongella sicca]QTE30246.1 hypothetical protein J4E96_04360 [Pengzhenrongella sicca]
MLELMRMHAISDILAAAPCAIVGLMMIPASLSRSARAVLGAAVVSTLGVSGAAAVAPTTPPAAQAKSVSVRAPATYPLTGTTAAATAAEIAACSTDQASTVRDPQAQIYYFKRGQVWYVSSGAEGTAGFCFIFGNPGDIGVIGQWGVNGKNYATPGVFRPSTGEWFFSGTEFGGTAAGTRTLGGPGDIPVVGDWNSDGVSDLGVVRGTTWYLQTDPTSTVAQGTRNVGNAGDIPLGSEISYTNAGPSLVLNLYRPGNATFYRVGDLFPMTAWITAGLGDLPAAPAQVASMRSTNSPSGPTVFRPSTAHLFASSYFAATLSFSVTGAAIGQAGDQVLKVGVICDGWGGCPYP